ncbi:MAG: glutamate racemase [Actinomycetota bacterium]
MTEDRPIGMFDSGVGGLTVARAVIDLLPGERIAYVGDNARFPYGPRPLEEIRRFAMEIAGYLVSCDVKMLVVACNSIEVAAIADVTHAHGVPVVGVIEPGVRAAVHATRNHLIGLIGTEATVRSGAYERALAATGADVQLLSRACPAFVDHVERGDTSSEELRVLAEGYLEPLRDEGVDTLILGCTHYPMLAGLIQMVMGDDVVLVSSAEETAKDVYSTLLSMGLLRTESAVPLHEFLTTGDPEQFHRVAHHFLGPEIGGIGSLEVGPLRGKAWS